MIYEMRVYRSVPGRLPALLQRFQDVTLKLWDKHDIKQAGFWTTLIGESNHELTYLFAWESLADREKKWNASGRSGVGLCPRRRARRMGRSSPMRPIRSCAHRVLCGEVGGVVCG